MAIEVDIPCPKLPEIPEIPSITIMGGAELKGFLNFADGPATDCRVMFNLMAQLPPLLAASACLLKMLDAMSKLLEFVEAVPSLDPFKIGDASAGLIESLGNLATCFPPILFPQIFCMIKGILQLIVRFLECFLAQLESILNFQASIDLSVAEGNPALQFTLDCARNNAMVSQNNLLKSLEPLQPLLSMVTSVGGIVGLEVEIPDLSHLSADAQLDLGGDEAIASIRDAIDALNTALEVIPC